MDSYVETAKALLLRTQNKLKAIEHELNIKEHKLQRLTEEIQVQTATLVTLQQRVTVNAGDVEALNAKIILEHHIAKLKIQQLDLCKRITYYCAIQQNKLQN